MTMLSIRVTWTDGTFHGREWPPSPLRLYQALLAGYRSGRPADPRLDAALLHLETLPPPLIHAPPAFEQSPVAQSVPNNDGDVTCGLWAKGADAQARASVSKLRTIRLRRPWRFSGPVTYRWAGNTDTTAHLDALSTLATCLTALGQGTDLAWARVNPGPSTGGGLNWYPDPAGRLLLQVPYPGAFAVLEQRYQGLRHRIQGGNVHGVPEPDHTQMGYRSDLDPPRQVWALFNLLDPDTRRTWSAESSQMLAVAAMTRHAIQDAALRAGLDPDTIAALMGHREEHRILIQPLPNVGHQYADGRIRRLLLAAPATLAQRVWQAVIDRLTGSGLTPPGAQDPMAVLMPAPDDDKLIGRFIHQSTTWTTATPVVLPGWDHRRGKPRPQRSLARLLRYAGIPPALVEEANFEPAPRLRGTPTARDCRLPQHLAGKPTAYLSLRFKFPVAGPLALGAGVGYGFGLLAACELRNAPHPHERSPDTPQPGERSRS